MLSQAPASHVSAVILVMPQDDADARASRGGVAVELVCMCATQARVARTTMTRKQYALADSQMCRNAGYDQRAWNLQVSRSGTYSMCNTARVVSMDGAKQTGFQDDNAKMKNILAWLCTKLLVHDITQVECR
jgi:hypothetical protein